MAGIGWGDGPTLFSSLEFPLKLHGQKIATRNIEIIAIPRGNGPDIIFKAAAILDYSEFEKLCPEPKPPKRMYPGGVQQEDKDNPTYRLALNQYYARKMAWILITSLEATEGLEWEKVDKLNPDTWEKWEEELREAQFTGSELSRIWQGVKAANGLDEAKIEEARRNFLARQEALAKISSSPDTEV